MTILRFSCAQHVQHVISKAATTQTRPNFIKHLGNLGASKSVQTFAACRYADADKRPISKLKNLAESTSTATFALGTHWSRSTGEVLVVARVGADPRIDMFMVAACFSASGFRRKSPALGL